MHVVHNPIEEEVEGEEGSRRRRRSRRRLGKLTPKVMLNDEENDEDNKEEEQKREEEEEPEPIEYIGAVIGVLFSVEEYTPGIDEATIELIDNFFDQLEWDETEENPKVDLISFGDLMNVLDTTNRWVYTGSLTTPPCSRSIYWNVLRTIYPIKQKHLDLFINQLARTPGLEYNVRITNEIDDHNLKII